LEGALQQVERELREAMDLLRGEVRGYLCTEAPPEESDATACYCIDLTDPNGAPACWQCRVRVFLARYDARNPGGEAP
jgi:hypothetical protein